MAGTQAAKVKVSDFDDAPARDAGLFLIDGSSLAFRSFFALPQEIATADGRPTGALLGFANMLYKLVSDYQPPRVAVAWDLPGGTVRSEMYAEYKAHRPEMPDLLSEQWPHFPRLVEAFGFRNVALDRYEADDVIGTLSTRAAAAGIHTCIVTYDRDALQLVSDDVVVMMTTKGVSEVAVYTPERVELRYGIAPQMVPDFIALKGDTSDNIPGVPGIGDKTAAKLLGEFGTLGALLERVDEVSGAKRQENLREYAEQARMSLQLATIVRDLELELGIEDLDVQPIEAARLAGVLEEFEMRTLARRVADLAGADGLAFAARTEGGEGGDGAAGIDAFQEASGQEVVLVRARDASVPELEARLAGRGAGAQPVGLAARSADDGTLTVAVAIEPAAEPGSEASVLVATGSAAALGRALEGVEVTAFDFKALPPSLRRARLAADVILPAYLLDPSRRIYLPGEVAGDAGVSGQLAEDASVAGPDAELALQAGVLARVHARQLERLDEQGMRHLNDEVEQPLVAVLMAMESHGICLDTYRLAEINRKVADQLAEITDAAHELAGEEFNLASPQQLAVILFEKLGLPTPQRKGKTGYSTDARVLAGIRDTHPLVSRIEQYRELSKLKGTYLDALPELVDRATGRIHTTFSQTTAATGRLSSVHPNLQNIPVRTALGREIRSAFVPAEGMRFVSCDYSQVELRLLAALSGEPRLVEAFERGDDVHRITAAEVHDVDVAQVTREQRGAAKAINFGIIYGISSFGLSSQLDISRDEAQQYIDRYLGRYPAVGDFIERTIDQARSDGYVTTELGRRRPIPEFRSRNFQRRQLAERLAVNTRLQGTAADIMKVAMIRAADALAEADLGATIALQIHDELLVECPAGVTGEVGELVRACMVEAWEMTPPLVVDVGVGENWLQAH